MKQKLLAVLLIAALTGMMFAGCGTAPEVPEQPTQEPTSAVTPIEPTEAPEFTDAPVATVSPTDIPEITEEPVATSTPIPTATVEPMATPEPTATIAPTATPKPTATPWSMPTDIPLPTPGPIPSISQIDGPKLPQISFNVYKCGEKGEEVLELVKSLREEKPYLYDDDLIELLSDEYNYSEQDILYGVYNSGWKEWCTEVAKAQIENRALSEHQLLKEMASSFPYIEEDVVYAVEHCGADWNQEATESLDRLLYASFSSGTSYIYSVVFQKEMGFTNEQIEYALNAMGEIDWFEQTLKKCDYYLSGQEGVSYSSLQDRLINSHHFDYDNAIKALESIKDSTDWNNEAYEAAKYFGPYRSSKEDLIQVLKNVGFTDKQIEYAINKYY